VTTLEWILAIVVGLVLVIGLGDYFIAVHIVHYWGRFEEWRKRRRSR
jgi:hypothetical protein